MRPEAARPGDSEKRMNGGLRADDRLNATGRDNGLEEGKKES